MAYTGYSPGATPPQIQSFNPGTQGQMTAGQLGVTRSLADPGYLSGSTTPQFASDLSGLDSLSGMYNLWNSGVMQPTEQLANQQLGTIQDQIAQAFAGGDLSSQLAQQEAGFSQQGIGLQQQQLGVREAALARQMGLLPQQYDITKSNYDIQEQQLRYGADVATRNVNSGATARGAYTAIGTNQARGDIQSQLGFNLGLLGNQRKSSQLSFQEQQAQQQDAQKMLNIQSQQLGLSSQEVQARLQNALNQIGISANVSVDQLLSEAYKVQQGEISPIAGLFGDIYQLSGVTLPGAGSQPPTQRTSGAQ